MDAGVERDAMAETNAAETPVSDSRTNACTATSFEVGELDSELSGECWFVMAGDPH